MTEVRRSYHAMLRAIGAIMEAENPEYFTIIELLDGFTVVLTPRGTKEITCTEIQLTYEALEARYAELERRRARAKPQSPTGEPQLEPVDLSRRQDVLRAIGYELDDTGGASIMIDELDDQMLLTYSYVDSSQGWAWHKRVVYLGTSELEAIVNASRSRRKLEPVRQRRTLFRR